MFISINRTKGISLVQQIYLAFIDKIRSGILQEGEVIPSVRELSKDIGVSFVTVVKAYKRLEEEGFIESKQGRGSFVKRQSAGEAPAPKTASAYDWQLTLPDYLQRSQYGQFQDPNEKFHFASSIIDPALFPNPLMDQLIAKAFSENPRILSQYGEVQGDTELRETMAAQLRNEGIQLSAENILVTSGSQQGIDLIARSFIGDGDVVIMEAPTYPGAIDIFRSRGAVILTVPVDEYGMQTDILQTLCEKHKPKIIYTSPTFHNPTGTVMPRKRRRELLDIAESYHSIVVEDDAFSELYFEEKPPAPIKSEDQSGHVVYVKGLSKTIAPGCRIGILAASGSIFKRLYAAKANMDLGSPLLTQKVILPLLQEKRMKEHTQKLRTALKIRRDIMLEILTEEAPAEVSWIVPKGGLNIWVTLPSWINSYDLLRSAKKHHISFLTGASCYAIENEDNALRLSFSYANEPLIREGMKLLCRLLHQAQPQQTIQEGSPHF